MEEQYRREEKALIAEIDSLLNAKVLSDHFTLDFSYIYLFC